VPPQATIALLVLLASSPVGFAQAPDEHNALAVLALLFGSWTAASHPPSWK
jgi:hypothetical protein